MHDPQTVAFDIKRPWPEYRSKPFLGSRWHWPTLITVWHVDPETDGSDDSCGWSRPKLTKAQVGNMNFLGGCEARDPWLLSDMNKRPFSAADAEVKLAGAIVSVASSLRERVDIYEASAWASRLLHSPTDNLRSSLCFLPGWHTNHREDREDDRRDCATDLFCCLAQFILRQRRPWYRHPKWHVWHWKIQVHPLQAFKRWAFSRCAGCGKRFAYGYSPTSGNWDGTGPLWFARESGVFHSECFGKAASINAIDPVDGIVAPGPRA
jgi:hypothetical protein